MRLYILDNGHLECDESWILSHNNVATVDDREKTAIWTKVPCLAFLIEHQQLGWILYDTGCHPEAMAGRWPRYMHRMMPWIATPEQHLDRQLARLGLTPADVNLVILSHLHMDHAGNIGLFAGTEAGKRIVVHEQELIRALYKTHVGLKANVDGYIRADFDTVGIAYEPVTGDTVLADGINLIHLEGHTPGVLGLVLHLPHTGTVICPSDAVYTHRNYGPPPRLSGEVYDSLGFYRDVEKVRRLQRQYDAKILFSHDWQQFESEFQLAPAYYE